MDSLKRGKNGFVVSAISPSPNDSFTNKQIEPYLINLLNLSLTNFFLPLGKETKISDNLTEEDHGKRQG